MTDRGNLMNVIEINNLTRDYGKGKGIFNVSFAVKEGEVFGFLGPNGAGKTTTIRHLIGFIKNKSGECYKELRQIKRQHSVGRLYCLQGQLFFT